MPVSDESPAPEIYEHLLNTIRSQRFLRMQGLGNEIPFFICPFKPEKTEEMHNIIRQLINQLRAQGIRVLRIDLYDLSIELLKKDGIWQQVLDNEKSLPKAELQELLQGVLDPEKYLIPSIAEKMAQEDF